MVESRSCEIIDLGLIEYSEAFQIQCRYVEEVRQGGTECLILCEHPPVLTMGRSTREGNILSSRENLAQRGIDVIPVNRGGDVTLHASGQLVAYPIIDLKRGDKDLKKYLYKLEQVAIDLLRDFDIMTRRVPGSTGVWSGEEKVVSIGVGVRHWVTFHGVGLNISTDLSLFSLIRPCGMDVHMTSMEKLTGRMIDQDLVKQRFIQAFTHCFQLEYKDSQ